MLSSTESTFLASVASPAPAAARAGEDRGAPAVRLLGEVLREARVRGASDIHIEPLERGWRVRLRVDGRLYELARPPVHLCDAFTTRIKVLAGIDIAERRVPQDGRLELPSGDGCHDDYRVSTLPLVCGEKIVLRRQDSLPGERSLAALGFDAAQRAALDAALSGAYGMILVTGPTGSGKTLTLYCLLHALNRVELNLCTVEDPAEIRLPGANQVSVREKAGLTFACALRVFLRQHPDVIMVGEIRDAETAGVAIKAAQTGHLMLSTLHTNDAPATLARLIDIGVAPYNLATGICLVTAQRLVRKLCADCRQPTTVLRAALLAAGCWLLAAGFDADTGGRALEGSTLYRASGCASCHGLGYRGRIGVHQVMLVNAKMRDLIVAHRGTSALAAAARRQGVCTLHESALRQVRAGVTSLDEALAATPADD